MARKWTPLLVYLLLALVVIVFSFLGDNKPMNTSGLLLLMGGGFTLPFSLLLLIGAAIAKNDDLKRASLQLMLGGVIALLLGFGFCANGEGMGSFN